MGQGTLLAMPSFISSPLQRAPVGNCSPVAAPCLHPFLNTSFRDIFGLSAETANNMSNCNGMFVSLVHLGKDGAGPGSAFGTRQMLALLPGVLHGPSMPV